LFFVPQLAATIISEAVSILLLGFFFLTCLLGARTRTKQASQKEEAQQQSIDTLLLGFFVRARVCVRVRIRIRVRTYVYVCMCTRTYTYACTRTRLSEVYIDIVS